MAFKPDSGDEVIAEINIVPMVDVILVVLIIFMVTAPMIMKPSININLPKAASGEATVPSKLNITLSPDGKINLDGKTVEDSEVSAVATEEVKKNPDIQAIISADKDVPHGRVVSVLDIVKGAGVKKFAISIDKK
ncbi:MAG: biopolymer transporter ExbD [Bdellovibrionales bacterium RIFCSPHIGHO2_01_FULL_40_29]|nr:MAG: biopolymer transporter ExbD [Bdellovibrionales bacterium RIFCSPHIGHO2_01_FULL_40_29]OFZ35405.1 MAG: biopolymer transporter ExbD [Bdellovibrionales bacterium RIFCSPHIGHO2_02_FULL_40_15]